MASCATNPVSKSPEFVLMSESDELKLGQKLSVEVAKQLSLLPEDDPLVKYVDFVGQRLAAVSDRKDLFYRFHVVDDATINAFALPGGYIYVHRGLINFMNSEAELAAVLGHEIGHVTARHAVQQYTKMQSYNLGMAITSIFVPVPYGAGQLSNLLAAAIIQGYGREAELQADELSIRYLLRAGYDVEATTRILATLKRTDDLDAMEKRDVGEKVVNYHGAFSSHPETKKRIEQAVATSRINHPITGFVGHEVLLKLLDGRPYGDSTKQGAVVGQRFLHPKLGIQLEFPDRWAIRNTPKALTARIRKEDAYFRLSVKELQKRQSASQILHDLVSKRKLGPVSEHQRDGFDIAHAVANISAPHVSKARVHITVFRDGARAFIMYIWSKRDKYLEYLPDFSSIATSFRRYDAKRDGDVPRIHLHYWRQGDSWEDLAAASGNILGRFTAERLAALNGLDADESPADGTLIKLVQ